MFIVYLQDMITGSGTGGINAILLGRLGLTAKQSLIVYDQLRQSVFEEENRVLRTVRDTLWNISPAIAYIPTGFIGGFLYFHLRMSAWISAILLLCAAAVGHILFRYRFRSPPGPLFDEAKLEECLKRILDQHQVGRDTPMLEEHLPHCLVGVTATYAESLTSGCSLLRNYASPFLDRCTIWQAAKVTMASLGLFGPITIPSKRMTLRRTYVAGTLGINNPTGETLKEVHRLRVAKQDIGQCKSPHVGCLISIGTGKFGVLSLRDQLSSSGRSAMNKRLSDITTRIVEDCEEEHRKQMDAWEDKPDGVYVRLNVEDGLQGVLEWKWSKNVEYMIKSHTETHYSNPNYDWQFNQVIHLLARRYEIRSDVTQ
ncbi:hypothetical protein FRC15_011285 [Serendipita sp. 397]|nr:hypothetical protein FRC15_011285 [Serendipita sp. 397]